MKKLIAICAVVALVFSAYGLAYAGTGLQWFTEWTYGEPGYVPPGLVTYGCNAGGIPFGHPTPHAKIDDLTYETIPLVQTVFWPHETIWAGTVLCLQSIALPDRDTAGNWIPLTGDDWDGDGRFTVGLINWFFPCGALALQDGGGGSVPWDTIKGWQIDGRTRMIFIGPWAPTDYRGLRSRVEVLPYGMWTVEIGIEDHLFSSTTFQVIPEPATMILLGMGLLAGAAGLKKKKA